MKSTSGNFSFVIYSLKNEEAIVCFVFKPYGANEIITYYTRPESKIFDIDDFSYNDTRIVYETKRKLRYGELYKMYLGVYKGIYIPEQLSFVFSTNLFSGKWKLFKERENSASHRIVRNI